MPLLGSTELLLLMMIGLVVVVGLVVALVLVLSGGPRVRPRGAWWLVVVVRLLGLVVGVALAIWLISHSYGGGWLDWGRGAMLAPVAFGACVVAAVVLGETVARPRRPAGVASGSLRPRAVWDYVPRVTAIIATALGLVLVVLLIVTTVSASDVDGQARAFTCTAGSVERTFGPYPGSYYSVPLLLALLVTMGLGVWGLRRVVERPGGLAEDGYGDDVLRTRSVNAIVGAMGVGVSATLATVAGQVANALSETADGAAAPCYTSSSLNGTLVALGLLSLFSASFSLWCLLRMVGDDRRLANRRLREQARDAALADRGSSR